MNLLQFIQPDWRCLARDEIANSEAERIAGERLNEESMRLITDTDYKMKRNQADVNKKLDQRMVDVNFWKNELDRKLDELKEETEELESFVAKIVQVLLSCEEPIRIGNACLDIRKQYIATEMSDDTKKEQIKEIEMLKGATEQLIRLQENTVEQIRLNRKYIRRIEKDITDKFQALAVDRNNRLLTNRSNEIFLNSGIKKNNKPLHDLENWLMYTKNNLDMGEKERLNSVDLRLVLSLCLQSSVNDLRDQEKRTNQAYLNGITFTRKMKEELEEEIKNLMSTVVQVENTITEIDFAIEAKKRPLMLAKTRLDFRTTRIHLENCRDLGQYKLTDEAAQLRHSLTLLEQQKIKSMECLKIYRRKKLELEDGCEALKNMIYADEVQCMTIRKSIGYPSI